MRQRTTVGKWSHCVLKSEPEVTSMTNGTIMRRALKLDKSMNKRLKNAVSDVAVRCSYFLYVCLRRREWCTTK